jgi:hypothetical protein
LFLASLAPAHPELQAQEQAAPFATKSLLSHWPLPLKAKVKANSKMLFEKDKRKWYNAKLLRYTCIRQRTCQEYLVVRASEPEKRQRRKVPIAHARSSKKGKRTNNVDVAGGTHASTRTAVINKSLQNAANIKRQKT